MAKILDLIYRVKDEASSNLRKIKGETEGFNAQMGKAIGITTAVAGAFIGVGKVAGELIGKWQDMTIAVGDFASKAGVTTQEASALMEMVSDLGVPLSSLEMAFKNMAKQGIAPSIEGLISVRAQLDQARNPTERLELAQKLLGRAGADLLPMFDQLTDEQLRNYVDTMTEAQVVTEAEYQAALKNRAALDELGDAIDSALLAVGGFLANGLLPWLDVMKGIPIVLGHARIEVLKFAASLPWATEAAKAFAASEEKAFYDSLKMSDAIHQNLIPAANALTSALGEIPTSVNTNVNTNYTTSGAPGGLTQAQIDAAARAGGAFPFNTGGTGGTIVFRGQTFRDAYWQGDTLMVRGQAYGTFPGRMAQGGEFEVGGMGGQDSTLVSFWATPGEKVKVGGDEQLLAEMRALRLEVGRLARTLPTTMRDAVERAR